LTPSGRSGRLTIVSDPGDIETLAGSIDAGATGARPDPEPLPFRDWDRYELLRELGHGGMGTVYQARDRKLGRVVALKFIRGSDPRATMRLLQEARAQARVDHPHVCKIFEIGEVEGRAYIAMQLVDGRPLSDVAARATLHEKVTLVRDVALALHEAHTLGVLHRDVKPANILVETDGDGRLRPVVVDFGLARHESEEHGLTQSGAVMGTPAYMSPEQARGDQRALDRRSDVYGRGATLYELLGGAPPFAGSTAVVTLAVLHDEPRPLRAVAPAVPVDLETIAAKCLAKEPWRRYDSARALAEDLDRYVRGEPIVGRRAGPIERLWRRARRHRALVVTAAVSLAALGVVGGLAVHARLAARRQAADLEERARRSDRLTRDVKEVEWFLRTARMAPVHDLTPELELVRRRIALAAERTGESALASYAVGRGHFVLDEDEEARKPLEVALAGGVDTPELHFARGVVLCRLHERALGAAGRAPSGKSPEQRRRELNEELFIPAQASLERARGGLLESPPYLEALIAYYKKDYPAAIAHARQASQETPWLYEALLLEGDAYLRLAGPRALQHDPAAVSDLDAAAKAYEAAIDHARSDVRPYLGRVEVAVHRLFIAADGGAPFTDSFERAEEWCRSAAIIAPRSVGPPNKLARLRMYMAASLRARGQDAETVSLGAIEAARAAVKLDEGNGHAHIYLANIQSDRAQALLERNLDATSAIDEAIAEYEKALGIDPRDPATMALLAAADIRRGTALAHEGKDADPAFRQAAEHVAAAARLADPRYPPYRVAFELYAEWATYLADRGRSPEPFAGAVADALAACVRDTHGAGLCFEGAARYRAPLAAYRIDAGAEVGAELDRLDGLLALDPAPRLSTRRLAARAAFLRALVAVRDGRDPAPARALLSRRVAACHEAAAGDPVCAAIDAEGAVLLATNQPERTRARELAALALERNPGDPSAAEVLARAERLLGRNFAAGAVCRRALADRPSPRAPALHGTCGAIFVDQARATRSATLAREAAALLEQAFGVSPLYGRKHGHVLAEAVALAGKP
jgi:serine/threonine-protein kinase